MATSLFQSDQIAAANLDTLCPIEPGKITTKVLLSAGDSKQIVFCLDAGQSLNDHQTPNIALLQVLSGSVIVNICNETYTLLSQHVIVIPPRQTHAVEALEPTRFLLTLFKEPANDQPSDH
jgi:quercetin dioxygenase-like cupin family protein